VTPSEGTVLVVGVGNADCGDDAAGLLAARRLEQMRLPGVRVIELSGDAARLMEAWQGISRALVIDAVRSGDVPGMIHRLDPGARPLPAGLFRTSTHTFSVVEAVELARALQWLPAHLLLYGIEGEEFAPGTGLSPAVEAAVERVVAFIRAELEQPAAGHG